ncbi:hypothetical protein ABIA33_003288 [Streptacidiphilus sp. MAP12-16]|uniref:GAF and ANTAR domain-containing protein n=1 Tax=Streptacidiphilus sp. MAP12-16 TaxID=3156300 RepID=UPI0035156811
MTAGSRLVRIRVLVAEHAARRGARVGVVDVCTAVVAGLPVGGAGVSVMSPTMAGFPVCSTDGISEQLEELQLTLGEGPCVDAFDLGVAVLAPDLGTAQIQGRWPMFASAAWEAGARAVFAFPLQIGAIRPGVLDLYSRTTGALGPEELADAAVFADTATRVLLDTRIDRPTDGPEWPDGGSSPDGSLVDLDGYRAEIDQATGMITQQLGVGIEEAFIRLRAHAYAHGRRLTEVAEDVVARRLRFHPDLRPPPTDGER